MLASLLAEQLGPAVFFIEAAIVGFLVGSIPFGLFVAKYAKKVDIRTVGSGNIGATNVARSIGPKWGVLVLVLDAFKGGLPTWYAGATLGGLLDAEAGGWMNSLAVVAGVATVCGHMFSPWIGFKGGKGVATGLGVALVLSWQAMLVAVLAFVVVLFTLKYVSLASIAGAVAYAVVEYIRLFPYEGDDAWLLGFSTLVPALIIFRHRGNIARLIRGVEPKYNAPPGDHLDGAEPAPAGEPTDTPEPIATR